MLPSVVLSFEYIGIQTLSLLVPETPLAGCSMTSSGNKRNIDCMNQRLIGRCLQDAIYPHFELFWCPWPETLLPAKLCEFCWQKFFSCIARWLHSCSRHCNGSHSHCILYFFEVFEVETLWNVSRGWDYCHALFYPVFHSPLPVTAVAWGLELPSGALSLWLPNR